MRNINVELLLASSWVLGIFVVIWWRFFQERHTRARSRRWTAAVGCVESTRVGSVLSRGQKRISVEIRYSYEVNGKYFGGVLEKRVATDQDADKILRRFPPRAPLRIRVNPKNWSNSVIESAS